MKFPPILFFALLASFGVAAPSLSASTGIVATSFNNNTATHRVMQEVDDFVPLPCNQDIGLCKPWSSQLGITSTYSKRVIIPCGECVTMDLNYLSLDGGLDIRGKLVVPDGHDLTMYSTSIVVQGELEMNATTKAVDGVPMIRVVMIGQDNQDFTPVRENKNVCGGGPCDIGKKAIVVAGGKLTIHGLPSDTPTWVSLYDVVYSDTDEIQYPSSIVVTDTVKDHWVAGAEILVTSHTLDWDGHQVRTITMVSEYTQRSGYVQLELNEPILRPTTRRESPDFAVEVALLSRNIEFVGGQDDIDHQGGHLLIMNTPGVIQTLSGVSVRNFGQQGYLGRYPIHIHFCGDASNSVISKNTIRESNQRCIVVHGTDNLVVKENIAYDTKGHCFILEDGMETGNSFIRNLGAQTGIPDIIIPDSGSNGIETDAEPATFWITNPTNTWVRNVAAGSQGSGYWFELKLRGPRMHMYPDLNPKTASITSFKDNIAHSSGKGLKTYPSGYLPDSQQTFSGIKSYRNDGAAVFLHRTRNVRLDRMLVADNKHIGIDIDRADAIIVSDTEIIGESEPYRDLFNHQDAKSLCLGENLVGIDLHTWKHDPDDKGISIENVNFHGYALPTCQRSVPIHLDNNVKTGQFDAYATLKGINIEDCSDFIDFCAAEDADVVDIYLTDLDGSLSRPANSFISAPSTLISDHPDLLHFNDPWNCTRNRARCYSRCNTCFRSVRYEVDPAETENYKLKVCKRRDASSCILIPGYRRSDDLFLSSEHRVFIAHLPTGEYSAVFLNGRGDETWPSFVEVRYEEMLCPTAFPDGAVELKEPRIRGDSNECNQLVRNGRFDHSATEPRFWLYRFGGLQLVPLAGVAGSNALAGLDPVESTTLVQYIDTRCLNHEKGRFYEVTADIKLISGDGNTFRCNSDKRQCPEIGVADDNGYTTVAVVDKDVSDDGFQAAQGFVDIDDRLVDGSNVFVYIKSNVEGKILYIDNVSMKLVPNEYKYCKNVILNSHMDLASKDHWTVDGAGTLSIVKGPIHAVIAPTDMAMRFGDRKDASDALLYTGWREIEYNCFKRGSSWTIAAKLQLVSRVTGFGASCDAEMNKSCPAIRVIVKDSLGERIFMEKYSNYALSTWKADSYNLLKTSFTLPSSGWDGTISKIVLDIRDFDPEYDLVVGNIAMKLDLE